MLNKRTVSILFVSLLITSLVGCGASDMPVQLSELVSISVTPTNPSIAINTSQQLTATGTYADNTTRDLTTSVTWSSSDTTRATVNNAGLTTGVNVGSATIMAKSGGISDTTTVTVSNATLVSVAVTPTNPSIAKGTTKQFTASGAYSDSTTQNLTTAATWSSSAGSVATISNAAGSNGLATAIAAGSTTITATSGGVSGSTTLTVTPATLVSVAVTPTNPSIAKGTTKQFTATGTYSDNTTQDLTKSATWSSSAGSVATISNAAGSNGLATSVAAGSTTITAISGSVSGTTTLTVTGGGSATLTWDAPTTRTDGSTVNPATDILKYRMYYGTASGTYTQSVDVANPGTTTITSTLNLSSGTWYFAVTAIDLYGQESGYSTEASKTL